MSDIKELNDKIDLLDTKVSNQITMVKLYDYTVENKNHNVVQDSKIEVNSLKIGYLEKGFEELKDTNSKEHASISKTNGEMSKEIGDIAKQTTAMYDGMVKFGDTYNKNWLKFIGLFLLILTIILGGSSILNYKAIQDMYKKELQLILKENEIKNSSKR